MSDFIFDDEQLCDGLLTFEEKALLAVHMYCETAAKDLEGYIKEHRPWTDRTGQARQRLNCYTEEVPSGFRIVLAHGVDYGLWLELANEKRYAVLEPTVRLRGPEIVNGFKGLVDSIGDIR